MTTPVTPAEGEAEDRKALDAAIEPLLIPSDNIKSRVSEIRDRILAAGFSRRSPVETEEGEALDKARWAIHAERFNRGSSPDLFYAGMRRAETIIAELAPSPAEKLEAEQAGADDNWEWRVESEATIDHPLNKEQALAWLRRDTEQGIDCWLMRRRPAGPWLPVTEEKTMLTSEGLELRPEADFDIATNRPLAPEESSHD